MESFTVKEITVVAIMTLVVAIGLTPMLGIWVWLTLAFAGWMLWYGLGADGFLSQK